MSDLAEATQIAETEASRRLFVEFAAALNISPGRKTDLASIASHVIRGLALAVATNFRAIEWQAAFEKMLAQRFDIPVTEQPASRSNARVHSFVKIVTTQPATYFSVAEREQCDRIAALAIINMITKHNGALPKSFFQNLKSLFKRADRDWEAIRKADLKSFEAPDFRRTFPGKGNAQDFAGQLQKLVESGLPSLPATCESALPKPSPTSPTPLSPPIESVLNETVTTERADPIENPSYSLEPEWNLFWHQKNRQQWTPALDRYRVGFSWQQLHPAELQPVLARLGRDLRQPWINGQPGEKNIASAACIVALFAGTPLQACLRLSIVRRGTMHLDLRAKILRRDIRIIADRKDETNGGSLNGRWLRTHMPGLVCETLEAIQIRDKSDDTFGKLLQVAGVTIEDCRALLNEDCEFVHRPEDRRFAHSLGQALLHLEVHPAYVFHLTGDTSIVPAGDGHYLAPRQSHLHAVLVKFCEWSGLPPPRALQHDRTIGSPKVPKREEMMNAIQSLQQFVASERGSLTARATIESRNNFHNHYVFAVVTQFLWSVGSRFARLETLTSNRLFSTELAALLTDKVHDDYSAVRCVPVSIAVSKTFKHYLEHLRAHALVLRKCGYENVADRFSGIAAGQRQTLAAFELVVDDLKGGLETRPVEIDDLRGFCKRFLKGDLNRARHFLHNEFVERDVAQIAIDALMGRSCAGAEPFGIGSGLSVLEYLNYLRPILSELHEDLGFQPLVGCGRTSSRFLSLTPPTIHPAIAPLPNEFLNDRLRGDELLAQDRRAVKQKSPFDEDTLLAWAQINRWREAYLLSPLVRDLPAGALLFCLVAFDGLPTPQDASVFYQRLADAQPVRADNSVVVEIEREGRVIAQRILSIHTVAAYALFVSHEKAPTFAQACAQLEELLKGLCRSKSKTMERWHREWNGRALRTLTSILSHAVAVEVPPMLQVSMLHKAPLIPATDLARIALDRPCLEVQSETQPRPPRHFKNDSFKIVMERVRHWADQKKLLGESKKRRAGLHAELVHLLPSFFGDDATGLFTSWLIAETSVEPPSRELKVRVLAGYASSVKLIFERVRLEGTIEFDDDVWRELVDRLRADQKRRPKRVNWLLQHVCAWLNRSGYSIPFQILQKETVSPRLPRSPIYVTSSEVERVTAWLQARELNLDCDATAPEWVSFMRYVPSRTCEIQFSTLDHFDATSGLFAATTSGHDHLKYNSVHGLLEVPKVLQEKLASIQQRRSPLGKKSRISLFGGVDVTVENVFEDQSKIVTRACALVTGRESFRLYDFRAAAITDLMASPADLLKVLNGAFSESVAVKTSKEVSQQFSRCAFASRQARHTTPFSTLRSYFCAGALELAVTLRSATCQHHLSTAHLSATIGESVAAIDTKRMRVKRGGSGKNGPSNERNLLALKTLQSARRAFIETLPTPAFSAHADLAAVENLATPSAAGPRLIRAALEVHFGFPLAAAADNCGVNPIVLKSIVESVKRLKSDVKLKKTSHLAPAFLIGGPETLQGKYYSHVAGWLHTNRDQTRAHATATLFAIAKTGTHLRVKSASHLTDLIELFRGIEKIGIQVFFQFSTKVQLDARLPIQRRLASEKIPEIRPSKTEREFGALRFMETSSDANESRRRFAPGTAGRVGAVVIEGLLIANAMNSTLRKLNEEK